MTFDEFMAKYEDRLKDICKPKPASVFYELNEKGGMHTRMKGRKIDLQFVVAIIIKDLVKDSGLTYDEYFDMVKELYRHMNDEKKEENNTTFEKMFKDFFAN